MFRNPHVCLNLPPYPFKHPLQPRATRVMYRRQMRDVPGKVISKRADFS
jgi:hypothetical protein